MDAALRLTPLAALRELPARSRAVVILRHADDQSVDSVARLLGTTPAAMKSLHRHTMEENATAIAAPVYWPVNTVTAAFSVVGPTFRISAAKMRSIGQLVVTHASELAKGPGMPAQSTDVAGP